MDQPDGNAELTRRLHTAICALRPDLELPLPPDDSPTAPSELVGVLTALADRLLHQQSEEDILRSAGAYNQVLGHYDAETDRAQMYERFAERIRFTGVALTPVGGQGIVTLAHGCLSATYQGAMLGAEFHAHPYEPQPDGVLAEPTRKRMNKRLISAQKYMDTAREGIAMLAGYPEGDRFARGARPCWRRLPSWSG